MELYGSLPSLRLEAFREISCRVLSHKSLATGQQSRNPFAIKIFHAKQSRKSRIEKESNSWMKFLHKIRCDWNAIKSGLNFTVLFITQDRVIKKERNEIRRRRMRTNPKNQFLTTRNLCKSHKNVQLERAGEWKQCWKSCETINEKEFDLHDTIMLRPIPPMRSH